MLGKRIVCTAAFAAQIGFAACQSTNPDARLHPAAEPAPSSAAPPAPIAPPTPAATASNPGATQVPSSDKAEVDLAGVHMTLTLADAEAIKAALLARLRQQNQLQGRDDLIRLTERVPPSIDEGFIRIGTWILESDGSGKLTLTYRMPAGPRGAQMYRAEVTKQGANWDVKDVVEGQIRRR